MGMSYKPVKHLLLLCVDFQRWGFWIFFFFLIKHLGNFFFLVLNNYKLLSSKLEALRHREGKPRELIEGGADHGVGLEVCGVGRGTGEPGGLSTLQGRSVQ